jgi:hypothetical protein
MVVMNQRLLPLLTVADNELNGGLNLFELPAEVSQEGLL